MPDHYSSRGLLSNLRSQGLYRLLFGCAAILLAVLMANNLVRNLLYDWYTLGHPYIVNPMEGREAVKAFLLGKSSSLYPVQPGSSFLVTIYPPLYHFLTLALAQFTSEFMLAGRLLSLLSTATIAGLIIVWTKNATGNRLVAAVAGLSFLGDILMSWSVQARPDMTAHALALGGAYLFSRAQNKSGAAGAALLAAMALYTKQQTLPFILGTLAYGVLKGPLERRLLVSYVVSLAVLTILPGLALNSATHGQFLTDIFIYPRRMSQIPEMNSMEFLIVRLRGLWAMTAWKTVLTGCWIIVCLLSLQLDFALLLLLVDLPFVAIILCTWGADYNYALNIVILMYCCLGSLAGKLLRLPKAGPVAAAFLFILVNLDSGHTLSRTIFDNPYHDKWSGVREHMVDLLRRSPGPILINTEGGQLFLGQELDSKIEFFDAIEIGEFSKVGFLDFDESILANNIASRKYTYVILSNNFMPEAMGWLLSNYYNSPEVLGQYELYTPRPEKVILPISSIEFPQWFGDTSLTLLGKDNIKVVQDHIEPDTQAQPALLTVEVNSAVPLKQLALSLYPRLNHADGSSLSVTVSDTDGKLMHTWNAPILPGRIWSGLWEMHTFEQFPVQGDKVRITFHLKGNAQLYFNKSKPMTIGLDAE